MHTSGEPCYTVALARAGRQAPALCGLRGGGGLDRAHRARRRRPGGALRRAVRSAARV